jgi:hypothetical protein
MYFKQFYLGCLAHASYLIGSEGDAASPIRSNAISASTNHIAEPRSGCPEKYSRFCPWTPGVG